MRCLLVSLCCSTCGDRESGEDGVEIARCLIPAHLFADAGVAPQLDKGEREKRPAGWIGERVNVSRAFM